MILQEMEPQRYYFSSSNRKRRFKNVAAGANPMDLKRGIDKAVDAIVKELMKQAVAVGDSSEKINKWQHFCKQ